MKAAVLMTCHNRREKTLKCLMSIYQSQDLGVVTLDVFLVDDASTDGTKAAIASEFPNVNIVDGTGYLYWNRGMNKAWREASKYNYDFYLWINDDVHLNKDALKNMFDGYFTSLKKLGKPSVIVGSFTEESSDEHAYGGFTVQKSLFSINSRRIIPEEDLRQCDTFNGNLILIPKSIFEEIGYLDDKFTHSFGDKDYGYRCMQSKLPMFVVPGYLGCCSRNTLAGSWADPELGLKERFKKLLRPTGLPPSEYYYSYKKNAGRPAAFAALVKLYIRLLFPGIWMKLSRSKSGE